MASIIDKNAIYNIDEMFKICHLTRRQYYRLNNKRKGPPMIKISSKNRLYFGKDLISWLENNKVV